MHFVFKGLIVVRVTALVFHIVFSYLAISLHYLLVNFEYTYVLNDKHQPMHFTFNNILV